MLNIAFMAMPAKLRSCSAAIAAARRPKVCVSRAGLARTTEKDSMSFSAAIAAAVGYEQTRIIRNNKANRKGRFL